ncbi:hypothetical protein BSQ39_00780 [Loigolactobacillus backii]|uniref:hypothetical protein n=1 Tax=Loigolactobacillus backii TaxID=375175 RepID=UPI000C1C8898|nr:hypothetical protein [Loigolactobacillus backii]PIO82194.1 hypothetical protein BSQ39_00780 [Loigolactobacillus backii]
MLLISLCIIGFLAVSIYTTLKINSLGSLLVNVIAYFAFYCALEIVGVAGLTKAIAVFFSFFFVVVMAIISFYRQAHSK